MGSFSRYRLGVAQDYCIADIALNLLKYNVTKLIRKLSGGLEADGVTRTY